MLCRRLVREGLLEVVGESRSAARRASLDACRRPRSAPRRRCARSCSSRTTGRGASTRCATPGCPTAQGGAPAPVRAAGVRALLVRRHRRLRSAAGHPGVRGLRRPARAAGWRPPRSRRLRCCSTSTSRRWARAGRPASRRPTSRCSACARTAGTTPAAPSSAGRSPSALAALHPEQTWEVSHVGGDRFAANLLVLPDGLYYGRVTPDDAPAVAAPHLARAARPRPAPGPVRVPLAGAGGRGRAAPRDRRDRARRGPAGGARPDGDDSEVRARRGRGVVRRRVRRTAGSAQRLTCRATRDNRPAVVRGRGTHRAKSPPRRCDRCHDGGMSSAIAISGLRKTFGATVALDGLDLEVRTGEVHGFLGPNGAGKSTTIRVLLGLLRADARRRAAARRRPVARRGALHRRLAYVPGDVNLWPNLTGGEVIDLLGRLRGGPTRSAGPTCSSASTSTRRRRPAATRKGNRQKVALVAALGLRRRAAAARRADLGPRPADGGGVPGVHPRGAAARAARCCCRSHILAEVEALCDRVSIIRAGRTVQHRHARRAAPPDPDDGRRRDRAARRPAGGRPGRARTSTGSTAGSASTSTPTTSTRRCATSPPSASGRWSATRRRWRSCSCASTATSRDRGMTTLRRDVGPRCGWPCGGTGCG